MADIIGVIGSVVGILAAAEVAYAKIKGMKGLPQAFDEVARRVPLAQQILNEVESQSSNASESTVKALLPVVQSCKENAEILRTTLEKLQPEDFPPAWSLDRYVSLIKFRGKKGRVEDLMAKILQDIYTLASYKTIHAATSEELAGLKTAIEEVESVKASAPDNLLEDWKGVNFSHGGQGPMLNHVGDYTTSWNHFGSGHINHVQGDAHFGATQDDRKRQVLQRLNASSYESHKDRNPQATANTCMWFTEHQNFRGWLSDPSSSFLWVSADPGCGKSVLARHLIDNILPICAASSRVIYFFFKDDSVDQKRPEAALRCLLHQLLSGRSPLFTTAVLESLEELGEKMLDGFSNLWQLFVSILGHQDSGDIICVLDALDECEVEGFERLIKRLSDLCETPACGLKSLLLSRPYSYIECNFRSFQGKINTIRLRGEDESEILKISKEIEIVIRSKVADLRKELELTTKEQDLLIRQLVQKQNRTYLWVHLVCDMLRTAEGVSILDSIQQIPKTVEEAYNKILNQGCDHDMAKLLLHIVVAAHRPLSLDEMATAVAIQSQKALERPELQVVSAQHFRKIIRNVCGLFVMIQDTKVYLIHQTAREFLIHRNIVEGGSSLEWKSCLHPHHSNQILARICIRYLDFIGNYQPLVDVRGWKSVAAYSKKHTLFEYSAQNWAYHYRDSNLAAGTEMPSCLSRLCNASWKGFKAWYTLFSSESWSYQYRFGRPPDISMDRYRRSDDLKLASYFGITQVCKRIMETGSFRRNHGYEPERRTALSWAAGAGHLDVVQLFLKKRTLFDHLTSPRVNVRRADTSDNTPLHWAARQGQDAVVRVLLATGRAGVNMRNDMGDTALSNAAENGHAAVIQAFLDDVKTAVDLPGFEGRTPLLRAAEYGRSAAVHILLATGKVDADRRANDGSTPLSHAARGGHIAVVEALLATRMVDVDSKDTQSRTPLSHAARAGNLGMTKVLLNIGKANVNLPIRGRSPLTLAIDNNHFDIAKAILARNADVDLAVSRSTTPLMFALKSEPKYLELLLSTRKINLTQKNNRGLTPRLEAYMLDAQDSLPYDKREYFPSQTRWNREEYMQEHIRLLENYASSMSDKGKALGHLERTIVESQGLECLGITNFFDTE